MHHPDPDPRSAEPTLNLAALLEWRSVHGQWAHDVAFLIDGRCFTHADVHEGAARVSTLFGRLGVRPGDRVLIALPDGVEFAWSFLAAVRLGAIAVPVNPRLTRADHRFVAEDTGAPVVVCPEGLSDRFEDRTVVLAEQLAARLPVLPRAEAAEVRAGQGAYAQYTSGTTGAPKAAVHGHGDPLVYHEAFARPAIGLERSDLVLSVSKLFFAYGLGNSLFFPLLTGCRAVLCSGRPTPEAVVELVRRHRVTVLFSVPTFYARWVATGDRPGTSLRVAVSAGERLAPALAERVRGLLGCPVLDGLGSTEVGQTFTSNTLHRWRDGTVGHVLPPYRISVRDDAGRELPPGTVGGLWVAGPTLLREYLGRPEATAAARAGEWLRTGDRAEITSDGFVQLHGRSDDVELVGGICVSPLEVEAVLSRHPAVSEVAVAAVIGPDGASRLTAFVVLDPRSESLDAVSGELRALARAELAPFKVPRSVAYVDALPRTPTGKLRRFVLRSGDWPATEPAGSIS